MKQRFRLYRRAASGRFYAQDIVAGKQESLKTSDRTEALRLLNAKNEAEYQPAFNAQLAFTWQAGGSASGGFSMCPNSTGLRIQLSLFWHQHESLQDPARERRSDNFSAASSKLFLCSASDSDLRLQPLSSTVRDDFLLR